MFIDVSKAYYHAPAQRPVYVELPEEALMMPMLLW